MANIKKSSPLDNLSRNAVGFVKNVSRGIKGVENILQGKPANYSAGKDLSNYHPALRADISHGVNGTLHPGAAVNAINYSKNIATNVGRGARGVADFVVNAVRPSIAKANAPVYGNNIYFDNGRFDRERQKSTSQINDPIKQATTEPLNVQVYEKFVNGVLTQFPVVGGFPRVFGSVAGDSVPGNLKPILPSKFITPEYYTKENQYAGGFTPGMLSDEFVNNTSQTFPRASFTGPGGYYSETGSPTHPAVVMMTDEAVNKLKNDFLSAPSQYEKAGVMKFNTPADKKAYADKQESDYRARRDQAYSNFSDYFSNKPFN